MRTKKLPQTYGQLVIAALGGDSSRVSNAHGMSSIGIEHWILVAFSDCKFKRSDLKRAIKTQLSKGTIRVMPKKTHIFQLAPSATAIPANTATKKRKRVRTTQPAAATSAPAVVARPASNAISPLPPPSIGNGEVLEVSGLVGKGSVLTVGDELYDVAMNMIDPAKNHRKFYKLQIVKLSAGGQCHLVQHWGRIGSGGQTQVKGPWPQKKAIQEMAKKFKAKTGVVFADRNSAGAVGGKYELVRRLAAAGAKTGDVAISLMWDNTKRARHDLDLHVIAPSGAHLYYANKRSPCGGELDVDRTKTTDKCVENIFWPTGGAPHGKYQVFVLNYSDNSHGGSMSFKVGISIKGEMTMSDHMVTCNHKDPANFFSSQKQRVNVTEFRM